MPRFAEMLPDAAPTRRGSELAASPPAVEAAPFGAGRVPSRQRRANQRATDPVPAPISRQRQSGLSPRPSRMRRVCGSITRGGRPAGRGRKCLRRAYTRQRGDLCPGRGPFDPREAPQPRGVDLLGAVSARYEPGRLRLTRTVAEELAQLLASSISFTMPVPSAHART
jgi:hypothetical protein